MERRKTRNKDCEWSRVTVMSDWRIRRIWNRCKIKIVPGEIVRLFCYVKTICCNIPYQNLPDRLFLPTERAWCEDFLGTCCNWTHPCLRSTSFSVPCTRNRACPNIRCYQYLQLYISLTKWHLFWTVWFLQTELSHYRIIYRWILPHQFVANFFLIKQLIYIIFLIILHFK